MALNTMKAPKGFQLQKAKIRPDGKLEVSYTTNESNYEKETPKHCVHDDLREAFSLLKQYLIAGHGLNQLELSFHENLFTTASESGAFKSLKKHFDECKNQVNESVEVTGFSLSGEGGNEGCNISGKLNVKGSIIGIASTRFIFGNQRFGFEEQLALDIDAATHEVMSYLFSAKFGEAPTKDKDQVAIEFEDDQNGKEPRAKAEKTVVLKAKKAGSKK